MFIPKKNCAKIVYEAHQCGGLQNSWNRAENWTRMWLMRERQRRSSQKGKGLYMRKVEKYQNLAFEVKRIHHVETTILPVVNGALGTVTRQINRSIELLDTGDSITNRIITQGYLWAISHSWNITSISPSYLTKQLLILQQNIHIYISNKITYNLEYIRTWLGKNIKLN